MIPLIDEALEIRVNKLVETINLFFLNSMKLYVLKSYEFRHMFNIHYMWLLFSNSDMLGLSSANSGNLIHLTESKSQGTPFQFEISNKFIRKPMPTVDSALSLREDGRNSNSSRSLLDRGIYD